MPPRLTLDDWIFERGDRAVRWATEQVPFLDDPLSLPADDKGLIVATASILTIGLLVLALRQFIRWRRERVAGPVELKPDGDTVKPLADRTRHYLTQAGVLPTTTTEGVGEVLLDAVAVLGADSKGGPIASALGKLKGSLEIKTGYLVTLTPDDDTTAMKSKGAIVKVEDRSSSRLLFHNRVDESDERALAKAIAARVYLEISRIEEIEIRTAPTVRWSTVDGLTAYQAGQAALKIADNEAATTAFGRAADAEPHHLGVQLALAQANRALAADRRRQREAPKAVAAELVALVASARAVALDSESIEAQSQLALSAGSVGNWRSGWADFGESDLVVELLSSTTPPIDPAPFHRHFGEIGNTAWRKAAHRAQRHRVWWRAKSLEHRRSVAGMINPISRKRASTFDAILGNVASAHYQARTEGWRTDAWVKPWTRIQLGRVRFGRLGGARRPRTGEDTVLYNLAIAYEYRGTALAAERGRSRDRLKAAINRANNPAAGEDAAGLWRETSKVAAGCLSAELRLPGLQEEAERLAQRTLERSTAVVGASMDLDYIDDDADLATLRGTDAFRAWRSRFGEGTDEAAKAKSAKKRWVDRLSELAANADDAASSCLVRRSTPAPSTPWSEQSSTFMREAIDWLGDDLDHWDKAVEWAEDPNAAAKQTAFVESVPAAPLNRGRSTRGRGSWEIGGPTASAAELNGRRLWALATRSIAVQPALARTALIAAEGQLATRDTRALAALVAQRAAASETAWRAVAAAASPS